MHDCHEQGLYGGLKAVERKLGIPRNVMGVDGSEAVRLWWRSEDDGDQGTLDTLLEYNREDVGNLRLLRRKLSRRSG